LYSWLLKENKGYAGQNPHEVKKCIGSSTQFHLISGGAWGNSVPKMRGFGVCARAYRSLGAGVKWVKPMLLVMFRHHCSEISFFIITEEAVA